MVLLVFQVCKVGENGSEALAAGLAGVHLGGSSSNVKEQRRAAEAHDYTKDIIPSAVDTTDNLPETSEENNIEIVLENGINPPTIEPQYISTGLYEYLQKSVIGKAILRHYALTSSKGLPMDNNIRDRLSRLVIQREKEWATRDIAEDQKLDRFV
uniref:Uncharacterized protein n=1 Tax=Trichogramma kaykai TaxID=54128 RepID=A0ABD2WA19_9HYME